jgi:magnesium chelatase family protein
MPVDRCDEPVSVRLARRSRRALPLHAGSGHALHAQAVGAAAGSYRHSDREIPALSPAELSARSTVSGEPSAPIAQRVEAARNRQLQRQGKTNRELSGREVDAVCRPDDEGERLLREAGERFGWSARAYYRVLKVARTIADLAGNDVPNAAQVSEAVQYRRAFGAQ